MPKIKSTEKYKKEVYDLVKNEYEVLGEYVNAREKISVKHNHCGNIYKVSPNNFLRGKRCPECIKKSRGKKSRKTHESFVEEIYDLVGSEFEVLSEYETAIKEVRIRHKICNKEFLVTPNKFFSGKRCPDCTKREVYIKFAKTHESFVEEVLRLVNNEYSVLNKYINSKTKIKVRHNPCGYEYLVTPSHFLSGRRCIECTNPNYNRDTKKYKKEVYDLVKNEYEVLGEYVNYFVKIKMRHNNCNNEWTPTPSNFLKGSRCPKCGLKNRAIKLAMSQNDFVKKVNELVGNEYDVIGNYINSKTKIKLKHRSCKNIYSVTPSSFIEGARCPHCISSKGETRIAKWLENNNIEYIQQYIFKDCKYKLPLRFDFAIFNNNKLLCVIEYDGAQHYKPVEYFGGKEALANLQLKDNIKNKYCKDNSIPIFRIPYWEYDEIDYLLNIHLQNLYQKI